MESTEIINDRILAPCLVEDCHQLSVGGFGEQLLQPVHLPQLADDSLGKVGEVPAWKRDSFIPIKFGVDLGDDEEGPRIAIEYQLGGRDYYENLLIETVPTPYGERPVFVCIGCWEHKNKLYRRPDVPNFACRKCGNLKYELTTLNKKSTAGAFQYQLHQGLKADLSRAKLRRVKYSGQLTKRAKATIKAYSKFKLGQLTAESLRI